MTKRCDVWTGALAGVIGGLAGSFVMGVAHQYLSKLSGAPQHGGAQDATAETAAAVARAVAGRELSLDQRLMGAQVVHFAFGSAMGGAYGAAAAAVPAVAAGDGVPFGAALYMGAHAVAVPRLGLAESALEQPLAGEVVEVAAHLVYGFVTDVVRRALLAAARRL